MDDKPNFKSEIQYQKLTQQLEKFDGQRHLHMFGIGVFLNDLEELFSDEIIWDKLHVADKTTQMYKLQRIICGVRNIMTQSQQDATKILDDAEK